MKDDLCAVKKENKAVHRDGVYTDKWIVSCGEAVHITWAFSTGHLYAKNLSSSLKTGSCAHEGTGRKWQCRFILIRH